ncbi:hypothetical protein LAh9_109 [Aeromonas phage LAh_9]|uniref:Uncharacterized protein n=2 Tax=Lahexavirus TaxID=2843411 RepID=A0A514A146_9CAUD|nr:hypothetical protein HWC30_gp054 [Aeromonas phage LAh_6]YP_009847591.1 hypothetical protein HWC32_gp110 [Aeromonas phage LAh_9]QDH46635.1 hypothetical protein LAh6_54 [Aeromonas phage LAh_6]QDH47003.1 hypothetical protein LAh9_109 [Aeromonas phage LAh_9]
MKDVKRILFKLCDCDGIGIRTCLRSKVLWVRLPPIAPNL